MYLKSHGGLMQFHAMRLGQRVDQVCSRHGFGDAIFPTAAFDEVVKKKSDYIVRLQEGPVGVDNAEAIGVAIGGNPNLRAGFTHLLAQILQKMIVGLGSVPAEQNVA